VSLVKKLREMGYDATMDVLMKTKYPDINAMMIEGLKRDKIIVVLSEKYKLKADNQKGGVWKEFSMIAGSFRSDESKFIFVTLDSLADDMYGKVSPMLIGERFIVDLENDKKDNFNELVSYITDDTIYPRVDVNKNMRKVIKKEIKDF
jgi:hypothetical protein